MINGACSLKPVKNRWNLLSVTVCVRSVRNNLWFEEKKKNKNIASRNEKRKIFDILLEGLAIEYYVRVLCVCFADFPSIFILSSFLTLIINNSSKNKERNRRGAQNNKKLIRKWGPFWLLCSGDDRNKIIILILKEWGSKELMMDGRRNF